jgi:hypothetical protein
MDTSKIDYMNTTLVSFMYTAAKVKTKIAESPKEYKIPIHTIFDILKSFPHKGSRSDLDHLQLIEEMCTLFELSEVSEMRRRRSCYIYLLIMRREHECALLMKKLFRTGRI